MTLRSIQVFSPKTLEGKQRCVQVGLRPLSLAIVCGQSLVERIDVKNSTGQIESLVKIAVHLRKNLKNITLIADAQVAQA